MKMAHVAMWTRDLDRLCAFWQRVLGAQIGEVYQSRNRPGYTSRFLTFQDGPSVEVMSGPWVGDAMGDEGTGYAHLAFSLGDPAAVDALAEAMRAEGRLVSGPRQTGDGYYEAVLRDPDGNLIEIVA
ncbi:MAG: VOC family protein [Pseudomonadota bacterium]